MSAFFQVAFHFHGFLHLWPETKDSLNISFLFPTKVILQNWLRCEVVRNPICPPHLPYNSKKQSKTKSEIPVANTWWNAGNAKDMAELINLMHPNNGRAFAVISTHVCKIPPYPEGSSCCVGFEVIFTRSFGLQLCLFVHRCTSCTYRHSFQTVIKMQKWWLLVFTAYRPCWVWQVVHNFDACFLKTLQLFKLFLNEIHVVGLLSVRINNVSSQSYVT